MARLRRRTSEKLRPDWVTSTDEARRKQIAEQVRPAGDEVPHRPGGQFVVPGAFRNNVKGVLQFGATLSRDIAV